MYLQCVGLESQWFHAELSGGGFAPLLLHCCICLQMILKKKGSIGDSSKVCMGLVLLEMHISAAVRESQYVNVFHISLNIFLLLLKFLTFIAYCTFHYMKQRSLNSENFRKFHAKDKCTVKRHLTVSYLLFQYPQVFLQLEKRYGHRTTFRVFQDL